MNSDPRPSWDRRVSDLSSGAGGRLRSRLAEMFDEPMVRVSIVARLMEPYRRQRFDHDDHAAVLRGTAIGE